jgi:hypothetical protein
MGRPLASNPRSAVDFDRHFPTISHTRRQRVGGGGSSSTTTSMVTSHRLSDATLTDFARHDRECVYVERG